MRGADETDARDEWTHDDVVPLRDRGEERKRRERRSRRRTHGPEVVVGEEAVDAGVGGFGGEGQRVLGAVSKRRQ